MVWKANFSRSEILNTFVYAFESLGGSETQALIGDFISIIGRCYDHAAEKVVLPAEETDRRTDLSGQAAGLSGDGGLSCLMTGPMRTCFPPEIKSC